MCGLRSFACLLVCLLESIKACWLVGCCRCLTVSHPGPLLGEGAWPPTSPDHLTPCTHPPGPCREGINIFLAGFVPTENLRFREESLSFKVTGLEGGGLWY